MYGISEKSDSIKILIGPDFQGRLSEMLAKRLVVVEALTKVWVAVEWIARRWGSLITALGNPRGGLGYRASPNDTVLFGVVPIPPTTVSR